ncbi:MAG: transcriptional repressor LexA [Phycisphaerae bacterium]|nr:transcriptional repressor LexA [Phycisphaerae bacterium]
MQINTTKSNHHLTRKQVEILQAVSIFKTRNFCSPTIAELAAELGTSRSTAFEHISELRKKQMLTGQSGKARSLKLTTKAQELLKNEYSSDQSYECETSNGIPLLGRVAAGIPIEAIETNEYLNLDSHFKTSQGNFALEVAGDSMIDEGIFDGDYVICQNCKTAENGQLVVAAVEEENVTLKRFYKEKDRVRLQPANSLYQPIYSENCKIKAIVVGLVRKF